MADEKESHEPDETSERASKESALQRTEEPEAAADPHPDVNQQQYDEIEAHFLKRDEIFAQLARAEQFDESNAILAEAKDAHIARLRADFEYTEQMLRYLRGDGTPKPNRGKFRADGAPPVKVAQSDGSLGGVPEGVRAARTQKMILALLAYVIAERGGGGNKFRHTTGKPNVSAIARAVQDAAQDFDVPASARGLSPANIHQKISEALQQYVREGFDALK